MATLKRLFNKYFQKSKIFLFPILGIKKSNSIQPEGTYLVWKGKFSETYCKLAVVYVEKDTPGFKEFERLVIFRNKYFESFHRCEEGLICYVFNLEDFEKDWEKFLEGKYSELSDTLKKSIRNWFGDGTPQWAFVESYLYPDRYYEQYAKLLTDDPEEEIRILDTLKRGVELCNPYDRERETLTLNVL